MKLVLYIGDGKDWNLPCLLGAKGYHVVLVNQEDALASLGQLRRLARPTLACFSAVVVEDGPSALDLIARIRPMLNVPLVYSVKQDCTGEKVAGALLEAGADMVVPQQEPSIAAAFFSALMRRRYARAS